MKFIPATPWVGLCYFSAGWNTWKVVWDCLVKQKFLRKAGNNSRPSDIVRPNFWNVGLIFKCARTWCPSRFSFEDLVRQSHAFTSKVTSRISPCRWIMSCMDKMLEMGNPNVESILQYPGYVLLKGRTPSKEGKNISILAWCYLCGILWCILSLGRCAVPRSAGGAFLAFLDWFWAVRGLGWLLGDCWIADRTA